MGMEWTNWGCPEFQGEPSSMRISAIRAAKHLCGKSGWQLTNLEVQKILYICHMLYLGHTQKPLLEGLFEAWDYGPVHPELYHNWLKYYGSDSVPESAFDDVKDLNRSSYRREISLIGQMAESFPHPSGSRLIGITHWEEGAWAKNYEPGVKGKIIPNSDVFEEYEKRYSKKEN